MKIMKTPIKPENYRNTAVITLLFTSCFVSCLLTSCATTQQAVIDPLRTHPRITFRDLTKPVFLNTTNNVATKKQNQEQEQKQKSSSIITHHNQPKPKSQDKYRPHDLAVSETAKGSVVGINERPMM